MCKQRRSHAVLANGLVRWSGPCQCGACILSRGQGAPTRYVVYWAFSVRSRTSGGPTSESGCIQRGAGHPDVGLPRNWDAGRHTIEALRCDDRRCAICDLRPQASIVRLCGGDLVERLTRRQTSAAHIQTQATSTATSRRRNLNVKAELHAGWRTCGLMGLLDVGGEATSMPPRPGDHPGPGLACAPPALSKKHSPLATAPAPERDGRKNMENISLGSFRYGKAAATGWPV